MSVFTNPKIAPSWIAASAIGVIGLGALLSLDRLITSASEAGNSQIASVRANTCRLLNPPDKVILGGYYFQPAGEGQGGQLLSEGEYICDAFGSTARIERGGYAQFIVTGSTTELNKTLMQRVEDEANPDRNPNLRVRRDVSRGIYQPPPKDEPTANPLFPTQ
ncbi:hypothetical protein H6F67_27225 [Microcoleus sp. FACHB-1515]|uniref:hypothetical protein n=1 Tax=Cyanophyceae TaxID=3028117 RepID=UPI001683E02D|nr:hypothetical protein [Microcoleus sp. FACHB-1515]MBD2093531.1 hypothetical protein [Microcoleus sp. FACHB-1515]